MHTFKSSKSENGLAFEGKYQILVYRFNGYTCIHYCLFTTNTGIPPVSQDVIY